MPGAWAAPAPRCPQPGRGAHLRTCARLRKAPNAAVRPPRRRSVPTGGAAGHSRAPPAAPPGRLTWAPARGAASPRGLQLCGAEPAGRGSRRRACPEPPPLPPARATAPPPLAPGGRAGVGQALPGGSSHHPHRPRQLPGEAASAAAAKASAARSEAAASRQSGPAPPAPIG